MWQLDCEESWGPKNWCSWTVVLEKTLESPLDCKEIQPVHPEGNQSWIFKQRTDAEAETPVLWPPHAKSWLIGKDPDAGRGWGQEEKGTTEDEMAGWHHRLDGHEFEWTPGVGDRQGGLACCDSWGRKKSDVTERLNWTEVITFNHPEINWISSNEKFPTGRAWGISEERQWKGLTNSVCLSLRTIPRRHGQLPLFAPIPPLPTQGIGPRFAHQYQGLPLYMTEILNNKG